MLAERVDYVIWKMLKHAILSAIVPAVLASGCISSHDEEAELDTETAELTCVSHVNEARWLTCITDGGCDVHASSADVNSYSTFLGKQPKNTRMGVFFRAGSRPFVSYPMLDRQGAVQLAHNFSQWCGQNGGAGFGAPPPGDIALYNVYCERDQCPVHHDRNMTSTPLGHLPTLGHAPRCQRMGVFAYNSGGPAGYQRAVVSYPMADRNYEVQVVAFAEGWTMSKPVSCP